MRFARHIHPIALAVFVSAPAYSAKKSFFFSGMLLNAADAFGDR
jgi:hypothetical protein